MLLITANQFFKTNWNAYRLMVIVPALIKHGLLNMGNDLTSPPLEAYVNHGRWIVQCKCGGAEMAWEEGWFMCQSCFNAGYKHKYLRSIFPKERLKIEKLLTMRPIPNRNWYPRETLAQLEAENKEHKAELLEVS